MRNKAPVESRDLDPIETILLFLLKNWILLICLPVIAGVVAFIVTLQAPRTFTATIHIPAPPVPIASFDHLWRSPGSPYSGVVTADGSVLVSSTATSEEQAREPVATAQAATVAVATESAAVAGEIEAKLSDMELRLIGEAPAASQELLAAQATAMAALIEAAEAATKRTSSLGRWSQSLSEQQIAVSSSNGSNRTVPLAAFCAFALALAIVIARRLLGRERSGRRSA